MAKQAQRSQDPPATHQPSKVEMEEVVVIDGTLEDIAAAVLRGGAPRKEPEPQQSRSS